MEAVPLRAKNRSSLVLGQFTAVHLAFDRAMSCEADTNKFFVFSASGEQAEDLASRNITPIRAPWNCWLHTSSCTTVGH